MSVEDLLKDLTAAVRENTAAIQGQGSLTVAPTKAAPPKKKVVSNDPEPEADEEVEAPKAKAAAKAAPAAKTKAKAPEPEGMTYDQVREKGLAYSLAHGRDALLAVLGEFGATKGTELTPDQYEEYVARLEAGPEEDVA